MGILQQLNITRALLIKPKVVLWDTAGSSLNEGEELRALNVFRENLKEVIISVM